MSIPAAVFKVECLRLMDEVARTGQPNVITKHGKPVAQLVPVPAEPESLFDYMSNTVTVTGDVVAPTVKSCDADSGVKARTTPRRTRCEEVSRATRRPDQMSALLFDTHICLWYARSRARDT